jgi:hypothetical protein
MLVIGDLSITSKQISCVRFEKRLERCHSQGIWLVIEPQPTLR